MASNMPDAMIENSSQQPEDEVGLPRAAVNKMIKEMIPNIRVSNDARELILTCCKEFIHLVSSEANDICNKQLKKTISPDHIIAALGSLGFTQYLEEIKGVHAQFKSQASNKRKSNRLENLGMTSFVALTSFVLSSVTLVYAYEGLSQNKIRLYVLLYFIS